MKQRTIEKEITIKGIGIHSGKEVNLKLKPSLPNSGINFVRVDLENKPLIPAQVKNVIPKARRTSLANNGAEVHTVEHLMAALAGLSIDNLVIEIDSDELPGLDGSSLGFVENVEKAGIKEQDAPRKYFTVKEPSWMIEGDSSIIILPNEEFKISYTLNYDHPVLKSQYLSLVVKEESFKKELAPSRTFCLEKEINALREQGIGGGATFSNTLVVGEKGVVNNQLRFENEFVRHKICDVIGDFYLLGQPLKAHIIAVKSGHSLNLKLLQRLQYQKERLREAGIKAGGTFGGAPPLDINAIKKILPHRYPFLLVDRIIELEEDKRAVGIKNVSVNENFFNGHFPERPVMPGVLIIEAMAQVAGVLMLYKPANSSKLAYFMSMDKVKFRKTVVPGDQLTLEAKVLKIRSKTGQVRTEATVEGKVVAEAELMFALVDA
ncbi:MAG: bifunctional UDP-3-O-[3-hydroxymyristoyl] N-acetylglucosamine deacetylase/3-hydroxyacyl-ACP dehydratase [Candidatus Omnitrophota bacterium]